MVLVGQWHAEHSQQRGLPVLLLDFSRSCGPV